MLDEEMIQLHMERTPAKHLAANLSIGQPTCSEQRAGDVTRRCASMNQLTLLGLENVNLSSMLSKLPTYVSAAQQWRDRQVPVAPLSLSG